MPIDYKKYGKEFVHLSKKLRAFGKCAFCGAVNYKPNPRTGSKVILTTHHIGVRLNAHHVIPWSVDVSLRYETSNGITLCKSCHKKEHKRLKKLKEFQRDLFIS